MSNYGNSGNGSFGRGSEEGGYSSSHNSSQVELANKTTRQAYNQNVQLDSITQSERKTLF